MKTFKELELLLWLRYKGGGGDFELVDDLILTIEDDEPRFWYYHSEIKVEHEKKLKEVVYEIQDYYIKQEKESKQFVREVLETEIHLTSNT